MTAAGQCRLGPLIPCIQDSSHLYDYTVKILFKLHASLPADTLLGHRERFNRQFNELRAFYEKSRDLQYFKNLIQVPALPLVSISFPQINQHEFNHFT
jgi:huntingtin interacting protein 1